MKAVHRIFSKSVCLLELQKAFKRSFTLIDLSHHRKFVIIGVLLLGMMSVTRTASVAQCAMCSLNAENSTQEGNTQGKGLNKGILFLLAMPFLIGGGIGILWYKKYRTKTERSSVFSHQS